MIHDIQLIHPTKCAGTTISRELLKLKGFSDKKSHLYSGYIFNKFFQNKITLFYWIIHSRSIIIWPIYLLFYCICFYFKLRNLAYDNPYGLTVSQGSIQHFTYKQWEKIKPASTVYVGVVTHPQHRIVSSFYFLGYNRHYTFLQFLEKIQDGSLISSIRFIGFQEIIKQHLRPMYDYITNENGGDNMQTILKRETLNNNWKEFCEKHKLKYSCLDNINKTHANTDWQSLYKKYPKAVQIVCSLYKKDFEYFKYKVIN